MSVQRKVAIDLYGKEMEANSTDSSVIKSIETSSDYLCQPEAKGGVPFHGVEMVAPRTKVGNIENVEL